MEKSCLKKICFLFFSFIGILFTSCEVFNKPVAEFLDYYTSEVIPSEITYSGSHYTNKYGQECIPSDSETYTVFVELLNIKNRPFDAEYICDDPTMNDNLGCEVSNYEDNKFVKLLFSGSHLNNIDKGSYTDEDGNLNRNVSGTLTLYQVDLDGNRGRPFSAPLDLKLSVNTKPDDVLEACVQADGDIPADNEIDNRQMVVCFKMKNMKNTVHEKDTHTLKIGSDTFTIDNTTSTTISGTPQHGTLYQGSLPASVNLNPILNGGFEFDTAVSSGYFNVYYILNDVVAGNTNNRYAITVTDDDGLSSSSVVSPKCLRLNDPLIEPFVYNDEKEKICVTIKHDRKAYNGTDSEGNYIFEDERCQGNIKIDYTIINTQTNQVYKSNTVSNTQVTIELDPGQYKVLATAKCDSYIDSKESTRIETHPRSAKYYVNIDASNDGDGSANKPFNSIQDCINAIDDRNDLAADTEYFIYLVNDYAPKFGNSILGDQYWYSFNGNNKIVLDGQGHKISVKESLSISCIFKISNGAQVTFKDITLEGKYRHDLPSIIDNYGTLDFSNGTIITGNKSDEGAVRNSDTSQIYIEGNVRIIGNVDSSGNSKNLVLPRGKKLICCTDHLDPETEDYMMSNSQIGITISGEITTNEFTQGFKTATGGHTSLNIFSSDQHYSLAMSGVPATEVQMIKSGVVINTKPFEDVKICTDRDVISTNVNDKSNRCVRYFVTVNGKRINAPADLSAKIYSNGSFLTGKTSASDVFMFDNQMTKSEYQIEFTFTYKYKKYNLYKTIKAVTPTNVANKQELINALNSTQGTRNSIIKITNSIDLTEYARIEKFEGVLDGCGNAITVVKKEINDYDAGLCINNYGVIQNLVISASGRCGFDRNTRNTPNFAAVCRCNYGTIENIQTKGSVEVGTYGLIAGIAQVNCGLIVNCVNTMDITNIHPNPYWTGTYCALAGIAAENGKDDGSIGVIINCVNYGTITMKIVYEDFESINGRPGEIVTANYNGSQIKNCYWKKNTAMYYKSSTEQPVYVNAVGFYTHNNYFKTQLKGDDLYSTNIVGCGYFEDNSITAGGVEQCKVSQTLGYGTTLLSALNSYVTAHNTNENLSLWSLDSITQKYILQF